MKVVIPAAGRGKRFAEAGIASPKELLTLGGKPLIGHALAEAALAGFEAAVVVISPAKESLRDYLATKNHPVRVEVAIQPEPKGIGDAVLRCWEGHPVGVLLPDDVVLAGDHWSRLIALNRETSAATLCVRPVPAETIGRFGIVERQGDRVLRMFEKARPGTTSSTLAIFGRYVVTEAVVEGLSVPGSAGELELTYGFAAAVGNEPGVRTVDFAGEIHDCGTPAEYGRSISRFSRSVRSEGPTDL